MMMNCPKCNAPTRMQVQAVISAPGDLTHGLSKRNLRRKDVYLMGVLWETADYICTNEACQYIVDGYGNYVTSLEAEIASLTAERDRALVQFVPEGWQLVPVALTEAMEQAIEDAWRYAPQNDMARREWGAALAAAPKPGDTND